MCYRALTGQVPDDATDRVRNDPLIPVTKRCAGQASRGFLLAIDQALSVDEGDRPQSVGAWREVLEADAAEGERQETGDAPDVRRKDQVAAPSEPVVWRETSDAVPSDTKEKGEGGSKPARAKWFAVVLCVAALLIMGGIAIQVQEQATLKKQRQAQAVEKARLAAAQAALEKQRRERAALEKQRQEQAALEKQRQEQAALEKQRREQAALEKQRREQAAVNAKDNDGNTLLHHAARRNKSARAEELLKGGADVNAKNKLGNTPLHLAALYGASATAKVLLSEGAKVNAKGLDGRTPLSYARNKYMIDLLRRHGGKK